MMLMLLDVDLSLISLEVNLGATLSPCYVLCSRDAVSQTTLCSVYFSCNLTSCSHLFTQRIHSGAPPW